MVFMKGTEILSLSAGLISEKKQVGSFSVDLTVRSLSRASTGGSLDFGGGEYTEAEAVNLEPEKSSPEEPYGWWRLEHGNYLVRFNESISLPAKGLIMIVPHERLLAAGGSHPAVFVERLDQSICLPLQVGPEGLAVKENARLSKAAVSVDASQEDV
ncbi:MAG: dCTP deaminase [Deltaproteobacteria bacterium]